ncbi:MAG: hypothetical protein AAF907_15600, partial [Planctomycetota bacterium]
LEVLFRVAEENLEREARREVEKLRTETFRDVRRTENSFWLWAVLLPPLPAVVLGVGVLLARTAAEKKNIDPDRRRAS